MEGTWGRRIHGTIVKKSTHTVFTLVLQTRERKSVTRILKITNSDLERWPMMYGLILDRLTRELDEGIKNSP